MKMRVMLSLLAAAVLITATPALANLLLNPGFETQGPGGQFDPANWTRWGEGQVAREGWAARSGSYGLAFYGWTGYGGGAYQDVTGSPGYYYTFTIWGQRDDTFTRTVEMKLEFYNSSYQLLGQQSQNVGGSTTWSQFTVSAQAPADTAIVRPVLAFPDGGGGGAFKWDDASLTSVIPEPATVGLVGLGLVVIQGIRKRMR